MLVKAINKNKTWLAGLMVVIASSTAQAALHDRGSGLIYDDVLNITWLADANYAQTSGYDSDGRMTWEEANIWVNNLTYHDSVRNVTYSDWRLPFVVDTGSLGCDAANSGTDCGNNVQTVSGGVVYSELAHMYYNNLGFRAETSPDGNYQSDWGIFENQTGGWGVERDGLGPNGAIQNLQSAMYWTGTLYAPAANESWSFYTINGWQSTGLHFYDLYVWAVRDGDITKVATVPEPENIAMVMAGLGLLGVAVHRKKQA